MTTKPLAATDSQAPVSTVRVLLRPEEGAEATGMSRSQFFKLLADGSIRSIKVGRLRRIPLAEIERWVSQQLEHQQSV